MATKKNWHSSMFETVPDHGESPSWSPRFFLRTSTKRQRNTYSAFACITCGIVLLYTQWFPDDFCTTVHISSSIHIIKWYQTASTPVVQLSCMPLSSAKQFRLRKLHQIQKLQLCRYGTTSLIIAVIPALFWNVWLTMHVFERILVILQTMKLV